MSEQLPNYPERIVPPEIEEVIAQNIDETLRPPSGEEPDEETAEYYRMVLDEYKRGEFHVLQWLKRQTHMTVPHLLFGKHVRVLAPRVAGDHLPKVIFGDRNVVHTSPERIEPGSVDPHLNILPPVTQKVVTATEALSFPDESFHVALPLDNSSEIIGGEKRDGIIKAVKPGGYIVLATHALDFERDTELDRFADYEASEQLERVQLPQNLMPETEHDTAFAVFRKKRTTTS